jgi:hypothetical protein
MNMSILLSVISTVISLIIQIRLKQYKEERRIYWKPQGDMPVWLSLGKHKRKQINNTPVPEVGFSPRIMTIGISMANIPKNSMSSTIGFILEPPINITLMHRFNLPVEPLYTIFIDTKKMR